MKIVPCSELYTVFMMAQFAENNLCEKLEIQLCPARSFISSFWPLGGSCGHGSYQPVCPPTDPCACRSGVGQGPGVRLELSSFLGRSLVTLMVRKYQARRGWRRGWSCRTAPSGGRTPWPGERCPASEAGRHTGSTWHGCYRYSEVKAIFKSIIGPKS